MSYVQEAVDIEALFATEWAAGPNTPIEYDNSDYDPQQNVDADGAPVSYVTLSILSGVAFQADLGKPTNTYRHNGIIVVQIHTPVDQGSAVARGLADAAVAIFRTRHFGSGIVSKTPDFDRVGRNGAWYQINVTAPFWRDTIF